MTPLTGLGSGFALEFDGDDETRATLNLTGPNQLTLEAWVHARPEWAFQATILEGYEVYRLFVTRDKLTFTLKTSEGSFTLSAPGRALPFDTWAHVAASWDGSVVRLFVDGAEVASLGAGGSFTVSSYVFILGGSYQFHRWVGRIDEVRVWDIARSRDDLVRTMRRPLFGDETGLAGYWKLDEGTGEYAYDSSPSGADLDLTHDPFLRLFDPVWVPSDIPGFLDSQGRIELEPEACPCAGSLGITLKDFDLVASGTAAASLTTRDGDAEAVELAETPTGSGVFKGQIAVETGSPSAGDAVLQVIHGGVVTALYQDADDGSGTPRAATDTAPVDCVAPVIAAVEVEPYSWRALVTIRTDELTAGTVRYGTSCDQLTETASVAAPTDTLSFVLDGLNPEIGYSFVVEVRDAAGNLSMADNGGSCFSFTTAGFPSPPFFDDFERGFLNASWLVSGTGEFRGEVSPSFGPHSGSYHLILGGAPLYTFSRTEANLFLDLSGYENVALRFHAKSLGDFPSGPPPIPFTGGADFDGVAISEDGNTWYEVAGLRSLGDGYAQLTFDLDPAIAAYGLSYSNSFRIRFNQYDSDGDLTQQRIAVDNVLVWGSPPDDLEATPLRMAAFSGGPGGPFSPPCQTGQLLNTGAAPVSWSASTDTEWISVVPSGGILDPGESQEVQVCIQPAARELPLGHYGAFLDFVNHESGRSQRIVIDLFVRIPQNLALGFDGQDSLYSPEYSTIEFGANNQFSVEAWVQRRMTTQDRQTVIGGPTDVYPYRLWVDQEGAAHFTVATSNGERELVTPPGVVPDQTWVHLAATWDGATMRIFVSGEELASVDHGGSLLNSRARVLIGDWSWEGLIDDVRVWDVSRSPTEIVESFLCPVSADETGLVGWWKMDEGIGTWAYDLSRSSVPLQLIGPTWVPLVRPDIKPYHPTTKDDLRCVVESGAPGYHLAISSYRWLRDGVEITEPLVVDGNVYLATSPVLSHLFTTRYESYVCVVNETFFGDTRTAPMTIVDASPTAPVVDIVPRSPGPGDALTATVTHFSTDADGDEVAYAFRWFRSQDGGNSFERMALYTWLTVPAGVVAEGEVWRVEVVPSAVGIGGNEGEIGWDQVYVGTDTRPVVEILRPATDAVADPSVSIVWSATDADGDPITVDLYYDTDRTEGGAWSIAGDLPAEGSISWVPPAIPEPAQSPDLSGDGVVDENDLFLLATEWQSAPAGVHYTIFARAWARGTTGEAFSNGDVIVPAEFPAEVGGLLELLRAWGKD